MQINLGGAVAGAATAVSVLDEYFQELHRIERIPPSIPLAQGVFESTLRLDAPRFEMVKPANADPYTRLLLTGSVERRFGNYPPQVFPLDVKVLLKIVKLPEATVGLQFDGVDENPLGSPLTENDVRNLFLGPAFFPLLDGIRIPLGKRIIDGLQGLEKLDPQFDIPDVDQWAFKVTLMPAGSDTVDSFMASIGFLTADPDLRESFVPEGQEFAIAFSQVFLDLALLHGAKANEGKVIEEAKILAPLEIYMNPDSIQVNGRARREVFSVFPDVTVSFVGPMDPYLVRGTTIMGFDMDDIDVDVGDFEEAFYWLAKWFTTVFAGVALVSGVGTLTVFGILTWMTLVQVAWNADVAIGSAPNLLRKGLANALGAGLKALSTSLDDDTAIGQVRIDSTPDSLRVVNGHLIFLAQVLVAPGTMPLVAAEYSKKLRRFVIFELEDGRRFRAQELARLMATGKITVPGFHQVQANYIQANPDNVAANNLLKTFKANLTPEVVLRNV
jgi:hypothetical protein